MVVFGATVWIAGTVFGYGTDVDFVGVDSLGPTDGDAKEVGVAKRYVSDGYGTAVWAGGVEFVFRDIDIFVGECGAADGAKVIEFDHQPCGHLQEIGNFAEGALFAGFGALAVTGVEEGDVLGSVALAGDGGADTGIHASTKQYRSEEHTSELQ